MHVSYCSLFVMELNFAKMGRPYFARTNFRDLKGKYVTREFNFAKLLLLFNHLLQT